MPNETPIEKCPFCGKPPELMGLTGDGIKFARCFPCGIPWKTIKDWNTREPQGVNAELLADMTALLQRVLSTVADAAMFEPGEDPHPPSALSVDIAAAITRAKGAK